MYLFNKFDQNSSCISCLVDCATCSDGLSCLTCKKAGMDFNTKCTKCLLG